MRLRVSKIHEAAKDRPPGYVDDVISNGTLDGEWLDITDEAMAALREKYRATKPAVVTPPTSADLPPMPTMIRTAARAVAGEIKARVTRTVAAVSEDEIQRRQEICQGCEHFIHAQKRCVLCGCFMMLKARMRTQHCPEKRW